VTPLLLFFGYFNVISFQLKAWAERYLPVSRTTTSTDRHSPIDVKSQGGVTRHHLPFECLNAYSAELRRCEGEENIQ
jgi:hypothetical protein